MKLKSVDVADATESLVTYVREVAGSGPVVVTEEGRPVAVIVGLEDLDLETVALSTDPEFLDLIESSRARHAREGGLSSAEVRRRPGHRPLDGSAARTRALSLEEDIELQYDEIAALVHEQTEENQPREEEIERAYARLRELQAAEAREFRSRFEASLAMPIGSGKKLLERLRALRKELEDLASADPASREADNS